MNGDRKIQKIRTLFFTNSLVGPEFCGVISQILINRRVFISQLWGKTTERNHGTQISIHNYQDYSVCERRISYRADAIANPFAYRDLDTTRKWAIGCRTALALDAIDAIHAQVVNETKFEEQRLSTATL